MEEKTIDLQSIFKDITKNVFLILLASAVFTLAGHLIMKTVHKPVYKTTMSYAVSATDKSITDYQIKNNTIKTFKQVIESNVLKKAIMTENKYDDKLPAEITSQIVERTNNQDVVENTNILVVTVTADNPGDSFKVACAVRDNCRGVSDYVKDKAALTLLENPTVPTVDSNAVKYPKFDGLVFIGSFFVLCLLEAFLSVMRDTIKSSEEIRKKLNVHLLSSVPDVSVKGKDNTAILVTDKRTGFYFIENIKKICSKLERMKEDGKGLSLAVTSSAIGEGRSTVAANIALSMAKRNRKVLLVDADMKNPSLGRIFGAEVKTQFTDYIKGEKTLEETLFKREDMPLWIMYQNDVVVNSSEIFASKTMREFLEYAEENYDFVIFDTAPVEISADMEALSALAETAVLVVRQDTAKAQNINSAIDMLGRNNCELAGCVFNCDTRIAKESGYGYYKGYGRYSKYGKYSNYGNYGAYNNDKTSRKGGA